MKNTGLLSLLDQMLLAAADESEILLEAAEGKCNTAPTAAQLCLDDSTLCPTNYFWPYSHK